MKQGTYIGPNDALKGETALLRFTSRQGIVLAQFDSFSALGSQGPWAFGWTEFPIEHFLFDENDDDTTQDHLP